MHLSIGFILISLVTTGTPMASVQGSVSVVHGGDPLNCVGVFLIPRSTEMDSAIEQKFGRLDEGAQVTLNPSLQYSRYNPPRGSQKAYCGGRFKERFDFSRVPPGEYFLTMSAVPNRPFSFQKFRPKSVEMMQRISVRTAGSVEVNFNYVD